MSSTLHTTRRRRALVDAILAGGGTLLLIAATAIYAGLAAGDGEISVTELVATTTLGSLTTLAGVVAVIAIACMPRRRP